MGRSIHVDAHTSCMLQWIRSVKEQRTLYHGDSKVLLTSHEARPEQYTLVVYCNVSQSVRVDVQFFLEW